MTSTITTSNTDRTRWQARGLSLLNEVWQLGATARLRPLMWSLGTSGVGGYASTFVDADGEATLRAWAELLGLDVVESPASQPGGIRRLYARSESWGEARAGLMISVDLLEGCEL